MEVETAGIWDEGHGIECSCGFKFTAPGEFRNCTAFITKDGQGGYICPECGKHYIDGVEVKLNIEQDGI